MPRIATPLTAAKVRTAAPGRWHDCDGLCLLMRKAKPAPDNAPPPDRAFLVLRYSTGGLSSPTAVANAMVKPMSRAANRSRLFGDLQRHLADRASAPDNIHSSS